MAKPKISIIAAVGRNRELGKDNKLLWRISEDLKHFKKITENHAVIMGQKTYDSIGKPLPNRLNVVLSKVTALEIPGVAICNNIEDAIAIAADYSDEIFVIGGGSVYAQFIDKTQKLYLTFIDAEAPADTFFPEYDKFKITKKSKWFEENNLKYQFVDLEKSKNASKNRPKNLQTD